MKDKSKELLYKLINITFLILRLVLYYLGIAWLNNTKENVIFIKVLVIFIIVETLLTVAILLIEEMALRKFFETPSLKAKSFTSIFESRRLSKDKFLSTLVLSSFLATLLKAFVFLLMYILINMLVADKVLVMQSSLVISILALNLLVNINSKFSKKDSIDISLNISSIQSVINDYSKYCKKIEENDTRVTRKMRLAGCYGSMGSHKSVAIQYSEYQRIHISLDRILKRLQNIKVICSNIDEREREIIKEQIDFILSDFIKVYNSYGGKLISKDGIICGQYGEYLKVVSDSLEILNNTIIENRSEDLDSAVNKLRSLNELNSLEEKYK